MSSVSSSFADNLVSVLQCLRHHLNSPPPTQTSNVENLAPHVIRRVAKELAELVSQPPEGIKVIPNEEDVSDIQAVVEGPGK